MFQFSGHAQNTVMVDRRRSDPSDPLPKSNQTPSWLKCLLNDVGFGILILDPELRVCFCNDSARSAFKDLDLERLLLTDKALAAEADKKPSPEWRRFLATAKLAVQGQRKLIMLGHADHHIAAALSPIDLGDQFRHHGVLVTTERKSVCEPISLWAYGKVQGLTGGELKVLDHLANGQDPKVVADLLKISVATVRTHIKSIISKTETSNLRDLMMRVAKLPPIRTLPCYERV
jgi:DNA-binding CsgD family transcriptional regulator